MEADWSLVALWAVCLLAQRQIGNSGGAPCQLSPAGAIKAIQQVLCHYRNRPEDVTESLGWMFCHALLDDYERTSSKTARAYPRKKQRERTGVPTVTAASKSQRAAANQFRTSSREFRLPA